MGEVEEALYEIDMMDQSDVVFDIKFESLTNANGLTKPTDDTGKNIKIAIDFNGPHVMGTAAHEMKHGFQYLKGQIDFTNAREPGYLVGVEDEYEAFKRGRLVDRNYQTPSRDQIYDAYELKYGGYGSLDLGKRNTKNKTRYEKNAKEEGTIYNKNYEMYN